MNAAANRHTQRRPRETGRALSAFADYVSLPTPRSIAKLHAKYVADADGGKPAENLRQLEEWSRIHGWQDRLKAMAAETLAAIEDDERATAVAIAREYRRRLAGQEPETIQAAPLDALHGVYDRVRPKTTRHEITGRDGEPITFAIFGMNVPPPNGTDPELEG